MSVSNSPYHVVRQHLRYLMFYFLVVMKDLHWTITWNGIPTSRESNFSQNLPACMIAILVRSASKKTSNMFAMR